MTDIDPAPQGAADTALEPAVVEAADVGLAPAAAPETAAPAQVQPPSSPAASEPFWHRDELRKSQKANKRLQADYDRSQRELEEARTQRAQPAAQEPDFENDPAAFRAHTLREAQQIRENSRLDTSELLARQAFGEDAVDELLEWAGTRPDIAKWSLTQRHPYASLMQTYKKEKLAAEIGDDPEAWRTAERARLQEQIRAEMAAETGGENALATAGNPTPAPPRIPSPAATQASARPKAGVFTGPVPLSEIGKNRF